jgi:hypothetical protein
MPKANRKPKRGASLPPRICSAKLAKLIEKERNEVHAAMQLWGDFPECNPKHCCSLDWLHVLQSNLTDLMEHARREDTLEGEQRAMRRKLATIIAACVMWDKQLEDE